MKKKKLFIKDDGVATAKKTFRKQMSKLKGKKIIPFPIHLVKIIEIF